MGSRKSKRPVRCFASSSTFIVQGDVLWELLVFIEENVNSESYGTFVEHNFIPVF